MEIVFVIMSALTLVVFAAAGVGHAYFMFKGPQVAAAPTPPWELSPAQLDGFRWFAETHRARILGVQPVWPPDGGTTI